MAEAGALLLAAAVLVVPGALLALACGQVRPLAWTIGPALTVLLAGTLGILYALVGIPWTAATAGAGAAAVILASLGVRVLHRRRVGTEEPLWLRPTGRDGLVAGIVVLVLLLRGWVAVPAMDGLGTINNSFDAFFHTSAVAFIRETGDASVLSGSAPLYSGSPQTYPLVVDALAALLPGSAVAASNALVLALVPVGLLTTLGLVDAILPAQLAGPRRWGPLLGGASTLLVFRSPDALGVGLGLWPNLLSLMLLPAVGTTVLHAIDVGRGHGPGTWVRCALLPLLTVAAVGLAHPSAFFSLVVGVLALALAALVLALRRAVPRRLGLLAVAVLVVGGAGFVAVTVMLRAMDVTGQPAGGTWGLVLDVIADRPRLYVQPRELATALPWWLMSGLGAVVAWRRRSVVGLTACALVVLTAALIVLGSSRLPVLGSLSSVWYGAPERLMPQIAIATALLVALGLCSLVEHPPHARAGKALAAVAAIAALVVTVSPTRLPVIAGMFLEGGPDRFSAYVTVDEQEFIERVAAELPEDAVVLGDPMDGTVAFWTVGGAEVVYPTLAPPGVLDTRRVGEYGGQVGTSAKVCASMERLGVTHLYRDHGPTNGAYFAQNRGRDPFGGIAEIPTAGLDVVATDGTHVLYAFEADCTGVGSEEPGE